nr:hypothetical protein [Tanacetum cinerariifolium]
MDESGDEMGGFGAEMVTLGAQMGVGLEAEIGGFRGVDLGVAMGAEVGAQMGLGLEAEMSGFGGCIWVLKWGMKWVLLVAEIGLKRKRVGLRDMMGRLKLGIRGLPVRSWSCQMDVGRVTNDISIGIIIKGKSLCYNSLYEFQMLYSFMRWYALPGLVDNYCMHQRNKIYQRGLV